MSFDDTHFIQPVNLNKMKRVSINPESPIFMIEIDEEKKLVWNALEMFVDDDEKLDNINKFTASIRKFIFKIRTIRFNKFKVCEKLYA